jgi:hypothetical protein
VETVSLSPRADPAWLHREVWSPHKGWASTSNVDDFSEEHNDFTPAGPNVADPWKEFFKKLRNP